MKNEFQYRLQKSLEKVDMTAAELSAKTGISEANISNYINGKYVAKQDKCYAIALALGVDPGWLMTGEEPRDKEWLETLMRLNNEEKSQQENKSPRTREARIISAGIDNMSEERRKAAIQILQLAFAEFSEYLKEDQNDDT